jgi:hypothetical protein
MGGSAATLEPLDLVDDGAHFGFNTADFIGSGPDRSHWTAMATLKPQLVIVNLGSIHLALAPR